MARTCGRRHRSDLLVSSHHPSGPFCRCNGAGETRANIKCTFILLFTIQMAPRLCQFQCDQQKVKYGCITNASTTSFHHKPALSIGNCYLNDLSNEASGRGRVNRTTDQTQTITKTSSEHIPFKPEQCPKCPKRLTSYHGESWLLLGCGALFLTKWTALTYPAMPVHYEYVYGNSMVHGTRYGFRCITGSSSLCAPCARISSPHTTVRLSSC